MEENKTNFITHEMLSRATPDLKVLETDTARQFLIDNYSKKGKCLVVPSPYHPDVYAKTSVVNSVENYGSIHLISTNSKNDLNYTEIIMDGLRSDSIPMPLIKLSIGGTGINEPMVQDKNRVEAEHNLHYWQLVVCGVIKVQEGYLLLRNNESHPRLPNLLTLIQGHMEPTPGMYFENSLDYIITEFLREADEELEIIDSGNKSFGEFSCHLKGYVQVNTDAVAMEHLGLVCVVNATHDLSIDNIRSKEPHKHEAILIKDIEDLKNFNVDSWVYPAMSFI